MTNLTRLPSIGDCFVSGALINTVTAIIPTLDMDGAPTVKIVLDHPLGGELHFIYADFVRAIDHGWLEIEPTWTPTEA